MLSNLIFALFTTGHTIMVFNPMLMTEARIFHLVCAYAIVYTMGRSDTDAKVVWMLEGFLLSFTVGLEVARQVYHLNVSFHPFIEQCLFDHYWMWNLIKAK